MSGQHGSLLSASSVLLQTPTAQSQSPFLGAHCHQSGGGGGGMRLEAVMENLQRQQTARLALEKKIRQAEAKDLRCLMGSQIQRQAAALGHYHTVVHGALNAGVVNSLSRVSVRQADEDGETSGPGSIGKERIVEGDKSGPGNASGAGDEDDGDGFEPRRQRSFLEDRVAPRSPPVFVMSREPARLPPARRPESPSALGQPQHHEWTFEEQFKQARFSFNHPALSLMRCLFVFSPLN